MNKIGVIIALCLLLGLTAPIYAQVFNPANGHYYELVTTEGGWTWYDARDTAAGMSYNGMPGHLATITSSDENDFVLNEWPNIGDGPEVWIGGTDEGTVGSWRWITGEAWAYANWNPGEPNNPGEEDCLDYKFEYEVPGWNNSPCSQEFWYLVEYEPNIPGAGYGSSPSDPTPTCNIAPGFLCRYK